LEWRLSYAIWTSIVAAIGSIIAGKATSIVPKVHTLIALAICILPLAIHGIYLHWIQTCLRKARSYIYKARKEMWKLVGDDEYEPPGEKKWYRQRPFWVQLGITFFLVLVLYGSLIFVIPTQGDLNLPNQANSRAQLNPNRWDSTKEVDET